VPTTPPKPGASEGLRGNCGVGPFARTCVVQPFVIINTSFWLALRQALTASDARMKTARLEIPPKGPKPPPDPAREEERRRHQYPLEIQLTQLGGIPHPVILNHCASRVGDQPLERQD
jgi:hypothetical protein